MENCSQWRVKYPKIKMCKKHSGVKWAGVEVLRSRQADLQQTVNFSHHYQSKHSKVNVAVIRRVKIYDEKGRQETMKKVRITDMKTVTNFENPFMKLWYLISFTMTCWNSQLQSPHHVHASKVLLYSANNLKSFPVVKLLHNVMLTFFTETICERGLDSRVDMEIRKMVEKKNDLTVERAHSHRSVHHSLGSSSISARGGEYDVQHLNWTFFAAAICAEGGERESSLYFTVGFFFSLIMEWSVVFGMENESWKWCDAQNSQKNWTVWIQRWENDQHIL